jgi:hypothetical protein
MVCLGIAHQSKARQILKNEDQWGATNVKLMKHSATNCLLQLYTQVFGITLEASDIILLMFSSNF